jgi:hypothetical protein
MGNIHISTMAGKLNGVIPPGAKRLRSGPAVDAQEPHPLSELAFEEVLDARCELYDFESAGCFDPCVGEDFAVLAG